MKKDSGTFNFSLSKNHSHRNIREDFKVLHHTAILLKYS